MEGKLVHIEDAVITALLSRKEVVAALPVLKTASSGAKGGGCRPCQAKARNKAINYSNVKVAIGNLRGEDLKKLKGFLGAGSIRVRYKPHGAANKEVVLTL